MTPQAPEERIQNGLEKAKSIIAVSSCKGGVGKSTIAANIAYALAGQGKSVGLLDADIHGPSIPSLFNLRSPKISQNKRKQLIPAEVNGLKIMSFGFLLGDAPAVMRGPMVSQYVQQILHGTAWGELDLLIIDMPPGTGDIQLTITQSARLNGAVIVTTPQTLSLIDVARGILMFEKVNVPILGIIENMSYFVCDGCNKKHFIFGKGGRQSLTDRFGVKALSEMPLEPKLSALNTDPAIDIYAKTAENILNSLDEITAEKESLTTLKFDADKITLGWSKGEKIVVPNRLLRLSCRCALCVNEITGEKMLKDENVPADIAPTAITPLGNYALGIAWNDRHSSGIYPFDAIRKLMQAA